MVEINEGCQNTDKEVIEEVFTNLSAQHNVDIPESEKDLLRDKLATKLNCGDKRYYRAFCAATLADAAVYHKAKRTLDDVMLAYNWVGDVPAKFEGNHYEYYGDLIEKIINEYDEMMKAYA